MNIDIINSETVGSIADYNTWVNTIEESFKLSRDIDYKMPARSHIDFDQNTLLLMPCIGSEYYSCKIVSFFPGNPKQGLPPLSGSVLLNSSMTGELLAIIDGTALTSYRTAAVGSFGIRHLAPDDVNTLGVIGLGSQGVHQTLFACSQRNFKTVNIYDRNTTSIEKYTEIILSRYPQLEINSTASTEQLVSNSEVIICATNSANPVLPDDTELLRGKTYIGIGSYKPDMREFPESLFKLVDRIYIDTADGIAESGDLIYPLENKLIDQQSFIEGGKLIQHLPDKNKTRIFKSVGMALFDLASAILVYEKYKNQIQ